MVDRDAESWLILKKVYVILDSAVCMYGYAFVLCLSEVYGVFLGMFALPLCLD